MASRCALVYNHRGNECVRCAICRSPRQRAATYWNSTGPLPALRFALGFDLLCRMEFGVEEAARHRVVTLRVSLQHGWWRGEGMREGMR